MTDMPACATAGVDMYPDRDDKAANAAAVAVCRRCPLMLACAEGALARAELYGCWGALPERRRESMRRHGKATTTGLIAKRVAARRGDVAHLTAQGVPPRVIAVRLSVSVGTVNDDLKALRVRQPSRERAAARAAASADLDRRIDAMNAAGASIDTICRELRVGTGRVVGRRRAVQAAA